jgi:hypothetical protein
MSKFNAIFPEKEEKGKRTVKKLWTVDRVLTAANLLRVALSCLARVEGIRRSLSRGALCYT